MVTRPLSSRHLSSRGAVLSIVFIWTYSLALTTPPLMGWGNYVNEAANISCSVNWHEHSLNAVTYILFLFAMGQIVPLSVITYSYVNIIRTLKRNSQRLGRVSRAETRATAMVFVMIVSFTVAWTPYSIFALMEQFAPEGIVSPGAAVIPALVAKSSICYDPLIYVGMNTQFRQSIKRIFGIHTKGASETQRFNNTAFSPAHRLSSLNTRVNSTELTISQIPKVRDKKLVLTEDISEVTYNNDPPRTIVAKNPELGTIPEHKTSDAEKSGETIYDDESSSQKKLEVFGESCKISQQKSPVLTFMDAERLLFTKVARNVDENVFGNAAYEVHPTDLCNTECETNIKPKLLRQSYSLDLSRYSCERKRRKLSVETKLENVPQPKGFFKETLNKFFEPDPKQGHDYYKSYLCERQSSSDEKDQL